MCTFLLTETQTAFQSRLDDAYILAIRCGTLKLLFGILGTVLICELNEKINITLMPVQ